MRMIEDMNKHEMESKETARGHKMVEGGSRNCGALDGDPNLDDRDSGMRVVWNLNDMDDIDISLFFHLKVDICVQPNVKANPKLGVEWLKRCIARGPSELCQLLTNGWDCIVPCC